MSYVPMPNTVDYIEIAVSDLQVSRRFFEQLFGWRFTEYGPDYVAFDDGRLNGGFRHLDEHEQAGAGSVLVVFYSSDLEATEQRVKDLGGTVLRPIFSFPGGRRFQFRGPDEIEYAIWSQ